MYDQQSTSPEMLTILQELDRLRKQVDLLQVQLAAIKPTRLKQFNRPFDSILPDIEELHTLPLTAFPKRTTKRRDLPPIDRVIVLVNSKGDHQLQVLDPQGRAIIELCGSLENKGPMVRALDECRVWETCYPAYN